MKIGPRGLALIKQYEGCRLKAYKCPAGVWTIGYGSTGAHVTAGKVISQVEADALLAKDLERFERAVGNAVHPTQSQFDAMVSLAFNIGMGAFNGSSVLRKHNAGDHAGAKASFALWNKAGGRVLSGLVLRRAAEAALYGAP